MTKDTKTLEDRLDEQYGADEWIGGYITVTGVKHFVAVKGPSVSDYKAFNTHSVSYIASHIHSNKKSGGQKSIFEAEQFLVLSCLIDDVPGVISAADFKTLMSKKPGIVSKLAAACTKLADVDADFLETE